MKVVGKVDGRTRRITKLYMSADTFQEERVLAYIVDAIEHEDRVAIVRSGELQYVFNFNNARSV